MEYRNTPLSCGYSPAQLLIERRTKSIIPVSNRQLTPKPIDQTPLRNHIRKQRAKQQAHYDKSAKSLPLLQVNDPVFMQVGKIWKPGKIIDIYNDRSYIVEDKDGVKYRQKRRLLNLAQTTSQTPPPSATNTAKISRQSQMNAEGKLPSEEPQTHKARTQNGICKHNPHMQTGPSPYQSRSGRVVKSNKKYSDPRWKY